VWLQVSIFPLADGALESLKIRRFRTSDIVKRLGAISPSRLFINNYPIANPVAAFNPSIVLRDDELYVYVRVVMGYYLYASAIALIKLQLNDLLSGDLSVDRYSADLVIIPTNKYDIWGCEDPRVVELDGKYYMTYVGRGVNYFNAAVKNEKTLPLTATQTSSSKWEKIAVHVLPSELRGRVIMDKDAFITKLGGDLLLFHRPYMDDGNYYTTVSRISLELNTMSSELGEVVAQDTKLVLLPASFEEKIGWAAPVMKVDSKTLLVLLHGVEREMGIYRVFAAEVEHSRSSGVILKAVTPTYIMEPRTPYEVFGDRPYTVFPCGAVLVDSHKVIISYGAADFMVGFGEIDLTELLSLLDKGRIY